jgi:hypothetical protein
MAEPFDSDTVLGMVRLGWSVAEVRGRNRPGFQPPGILELPQRTDHALPLEIERTAPERRIEAQTVLDALARNLGIDADSAAWFSFTDELDTAAVRLAGATAPAGPAGGAATVPPAAPAALAAAPTAPTAVDGAAASPVAAVDGAAASPTAAVTTAGTVAGDWDALEELIYKFAAHIQDTLATRSLTVAAGYQLGRALAECFWALDPSLPDKPATWEAWSFLLSRDRCSEIGRLLGRLSAYFNPYTAPAIAGSVQVWQNVAKSTEWRASAYPRLYDQIRGWYELILLKQDPTTLVKPYQILKSYRLVWRTLRGFWFQLLVAALAAGAVGAFAWLLTKPSFSAGIKTLLVTLGIAGFSYAGLAVKVKNEAQAMLTRLKQDAYTDLITEAITTAPLPPRSVLAPKGRLIPPITRKAKMMKIIQSRDITPVTPS